MSLIDDNTYEFTLHFDDIEGTSGFKLASAVKDYIGYAIMKGIDPIKVEYFLSHFNSNMRELCNLSSLRSKYDDWERVGKAMFPSDSVPPASNNELPQSFDISNTLSYLRLLKSG